MDLLASYGEGSNTPKVDQLGEDTLVMDSEKSTRNLTAEYDKMMSALRPDKASVRHTSESSGKNTTSKLGSDKSNSGSDSSSDDSSSDEEDEKEKLEATKQRPSDSSDYSSDASSGSDSGASDEGKQKLSKQPEVSTSEKGRKASTSSKVSARRSRSRSGSKGRRHVRSDRRRRSHSRSRDHRHGHSHKSSRSERRSSRRSRSRSKDKHSRRRSSRDRRHRDGHRRHHSSSRDSRRRRRRSPSHRRRHRSPEHKNSRPEKKHRSRSPIKTSKSEESSSGATSHRPPVFVTAGVKFSRGRGNDSGGFKEALKQEFLQKIQQAQNAAMGNNSQVSAGASLMTSSVATQSAGTGLMGSGGMKQVLMNQMQQLTQQPPSLLSGAHGTLTPEQMQLNQRALLVATGRTREQVEAEYGIKVPTIYNENTNNLQEWARREQKKSLLWKKKDPKDKASAAFGVSTFIPGHSKEENDKLSRLLGCRKRHGVEQDESKEETPVAEEEKAVESQQELQNNLMMQYDQARMSTHFNRGVGLGYASTLYQPR